MRAAPGRFAYEAMIVPDDVELLEFGGQHALFHQGLQQLVELNDTASWIWRRLAAGEVPSVVAASLVERGASQDQAAGFVAEALQQWLSVGWLAPGSLANLLSEPPQMTVRLSILEIGFGVFIYASTPLEGVLELLAPLQGEAPQKHRLDIVGWDERYLLLVDRRCRGLFSHDEIAPAIKAVLTERLTSSLTDGFFAHGALLEVSKRRLFLSGSPGAGKSTLAMGLTGAGFQCLSDDIVHVDANGNMAGAPFALTLKSGSWPLLEATALEIEALPVHRRADGQQVRYAQAAVSSAASRPLDYFIALARREEGPAELKSLSGLEAMRMLLEGALAASRRISAAEVRALAQTFAKANCSVLHYSSLPDAVQEVSRLLHA
jgi:hypothetical protein